jgi:hypothetical protein
VAFGFGTASPGPGLDPDALSYVGAAISLVHSGSYRVPTSRWVAADTTAPLTHYPPGFSTLIAGPLALGLAPLSSARLVIVVSAFVTWVGLVLLIARAAGTRAGVLGATAVLASPAVVTQHLSVLSEPPFLVALVMTVGGMAWMARRAETQGSRLAESGVALATGLAGAAAVMVRYAGLALVGAAVLWAVACSTARAGSRARGSGKRVDWPAAFRRAALVVAPTILVLGPWLLRTQRLGSANGVRTLGIYSGFGATALEGLRTIASWLVPIGHGSWRIGVAIAIALAGLTVVVSTYVRLNGMDETAGGVRPDEARAACVLGAILYAGLAYLLFLVASRLAADRFIPFDERLLVPLMLLAECAVAIVVALWWRGGTSAPEQGATQRRERSRHRAAVGLILIVWFVASAAGSVQRISAARLDGEDLAGSDWLDSPTIAWVRSPAGGLNRVLYTNWPAALYFHAGRAAHDLPDNLDPLTLHRLRDRLSRNNGVLVGFTINNPDAEPVSVLAPALGLREVAHFDDGSVWELPSSSPQTTRAGSREGEPALGCPAGRPLSGAVRP